MDFQIKLAVISIAVIIPLSTSAVWISGQENYLENTRNNSTKITVLTSFYPLYEFTQEIAGEQIEVSLLVPQGVEPHDWEPTIKDFQRIRQADAVIINGMGFESWIDDLEELNNKPKIIDSSTGIKPLDNDFEIIKEHEQPHMDFPRGDPHIWLNPILAKKQVTNIKNGLIKLDPHNEQVYQKKSENYLKKLDILDSKIKTELSNCKKDFLIYHNAFSYFAKQYGLQQHTIVQTNDPHADPTPKNIENIINLSRELELKVVFTEEGIDQRTSNVIAKELGSKVLKLSTLEIIDNNSSYFEKMEENLSNLKEELCN